MELVVAPVDDEPAHVRTCHGDHGPVGLRSPGPVVAGLGVYCMRRKACASGVSRPRAFSSAVRLDAYTR